MVSRGRTAREHRTERPRVRSPRLRFANAAHPVRTDFGLRELESGSVPCTKTKCT
jgi:hypothetical protein